MTLRQLAQHSLLVVPRSILLISRTQSCMYLVLACRGKKYLTYLKQPHWLPFLSNPWSRTPRPSASTANSSVNPDPCRGARLWNKLQSWPLRRECMQRHPVRACPCLLQLWGWNYLGEPNGACLWVSISLTTKPNARQALFMGRWDQWGWRVMVWVYEHGRAAEIKAFLTYSQQVYLSVLNMKGTKSVCFWVFLFLPFTFW